jgi:hypothetical protein
LNKQKQKNCPPSLAKEKELGGEREREENKQMSNPPIPKERVLGGS